MRLVGIAELERAGLDLIRVAAEEQLAAGRDVGLPSEPRIVRRAEHAQVRADGHLPIAGVDRDRVVGQDAEVERHQRRPRAPRRGPRGTTVSFD